MMHIMKKQIIAKDYREARKKLKLRFPKWYYITMKRISVKPNVYEFTIKKRKRKSYKSKFRKNIKFKILDRSTVNRM